MSHAEHTEHDHADNHAAGQPRDAAGPQQHGPSGEHPGHSEAMFVRPFWIALVLTVPILLYAEPIEHLLGYTAPRFPGVGLARGGAGERDLLVLRLGLPGGRPAPSCGAARPG